MGTVTCPAVPVATISPAVSGLTFSQLSRGSGVTCGSAASGISGSGFNVTLASALAGSKWYTLGITSDASVTFTVSSLSIVSQVSSSTGSPSVDVQYSIGGGAKTSIGSFIPTTTSAAYVFTPGTPISVSASQTIDFFFIPNNLTAAGTTCRINNNTSINVTTTPNCTLPTVQASGLTLSGITENQMTLNWSGNGDGSGGVIILAKAGSAVSSPPASVSSYTANSIFGSGSLIGTGNYVVYSGTGSSITVTGLTAQTNYYFAVYTFNAAGPCYMTSSPPAVNNYTLSNPATAHAGSFAATLSSCSDIALTWTAGTFPGSGATNKGYIILMRSDGVDPTSSGITNATAPGSLSFPIGTTLAAIIPSSATVAATITGLSSTTVYNFAIIPYTFDGANSVTYNYFTGGTIPTGNASTGGPTSTYYYRSKATGNWNTVGTWEASPTGAGGWVNACTVPTSTATAIQIQGGHTVTINTNATAPNLTIDGILIFDNTVRNVSVTDYITVSAGATFITQAAGAATHTLAMGGNLTNNGTFDLSRGGTTLVCNITFNKNGNQSVSGIGATTRFNFITVNLGASISNILDIYPSNFSAAGNFLHPGSSAAANSLKNGTIKFSGSFTFTGNFFQTGAFYKIVSTAAIWINNPNFTVSGQNDTYIISGQLRITTGIFNAGTSLGNSIQLLTNSKLTIDGGTLNVASRIQANNTSGTSQLNVAYRQSGGTVNLTTTGANTSGSLADFEFDLPSDSLIISGGIIIFKCVATLQPDIYNYATSVITGGIIQMGSSTTPSTALNFEIESGSALPSLVINNASLLNPYVFLADNLTIIGNITINSGTTLDNKYDPTFQYDISLTGNWNNSGLFKHNNVKTVTFNGSAAESITGTTTTSFNNLTINNSSGGVTLSTPAIIAGTTGILTLTNGYLYTSGTNILTMNAGTSTTGANNNSFVYGPLSKIGSTNFTFPVGKDLKYRPIAASSLSGSETFTAEYFHSDPDAVPYDITLKDPSLDDIGRCEYWILNRAGAVNANVTLSWDSYSCGVTSLPDLAVARWDGSMWKDEGNTATTGAPDPATGTVTSGLVTSFSPFTLASKVSGVNPLPVELLSFTANYNKVNTVDLKWITASEKNNDYFTIERSANAIEFNELEKINGAGNSSRTLNYSTIDNSPLKDVSYYRLKQTDYNGDFKYSNIVTVQRDETGFEIIGTEQLSEQIAVYYSCSNNCLISFELYDMTGKTVYFTSENTSGDHTKLLIPTGNLSHGIYLLKASDGSKLISKKIRVY